MQFEVRALSADNVMALLIVDATDEADARRQVAAQGAFAASIRQASPDMFGAARFGKSGYPLR